jgi:hypothetical protein
MEMVLPARFISFIYTRTGFISFLMPDQQNRLDCRTPPGIGYGFVDFMKFIEPEKTIERESPSPV